VRTMIKLRRVSYYDNKPRAEHHWSMLSRRVCHWSNNGDDGDVKRALICWCRSFPQKNERGKQKQFLRRAGQQTEKIDQMTMEVSSLRRSSSSFLRNLPLTRMRESAKFLRTSYLTFLDQTRRCRLEWKRATRARRAWGL